MKTIVSKTYNANEIEFAVSEAEVRAEPRKVLMCTPEYFNIIDVKNIHMKNNQGAADLSLAMQQWIGLKQVYQSLVASGLLEEILILPGELGLEDMVFVANQSFPWIDAVGKKIVVMSNMKHDSRKREVPFFEKLYRNLGYEIIHLPKDLFLEGMGDIIPHPERRILYGGYGHRTTKETYSKLSSVLDVPIVPLELKDERFYHLDTCFVPLDLDTVMLCSEAFTAEGISAIEKLFKKVLKVPAKEAQLHFSLNAHVMTIAGKKIAIMQKGGTTVMDFLKLYGYEIFELDTSEFMKSGGSVFCMKMMLY